MTPNDLARLDAFHDGLLTGIHHQENRVRLTLTLGENPEEVWLASDKPLVVAGIGIVLPLLISHFEVGESTDETLTPSLLVQLHPYLGDTFYHLSVVANYGDGLTIAGKAPIRLETAPTR